MFSRSLLLVLLVLTCLQSFTTAEHANEPKECCFKYQTHPISVKFITSYEVNVQCTNSGVIFTLKDGRRVCANPGDQWVQDRMKEIDQDLIAKAKPSV